MIFPDCFSNLPFKRTPMISKNLKYGKEFDQNGLLHIPILNLPNMPKLYVFVSGFKKEISFKSS